MKTDDLIGHLAIDLKPARAGFVLRVLLPGLGLGVLATILVMLNWLHPRPDLHAAMGLWAFWMKFIYTAAIALVGLVIVERQARAGADSRYPEALLLAPLVVMMMLASIALAAPDADMAKLVMGDTWSVCPWRIVLLSLPVLAGLFVVLRKLAPTRLGLTGAAAGLVAGATAATVYGFHCTETAAPFVLIWYTLGIGVAAGLGALLGTRLLRW